MKTNCIDECTEIRYSLSHRQSGCHAQEPIFSLITGDESSLITFQTKTGISTICLTLLGKTEFHGDEYFGKYGEEIILMNELHAGRDLYIPRLTIEHTIHHLLSFPSVLILVHLNAEELRPSDSQRQFKIRVANLGVMFPSI